MPVERRRKDDHAFSLDEFAELRAQPPRPGAGPQKKNRAPQQDTELADGGGRTAAQQVREKAPDKASGFLQKLRLVQPP
jgi:hypothetical protein